MGSSDEWSGDAVDCSLVTGGTEQVTGAPFSLTSLYSLNFLGGLDAGSPSYILQSS